MRIGALIHMYPPHHLAGAELMLHSILRNMVSRGHTCTVCVMPLKGDNPCMEPYVIDGVNVSGHGRTLDGCDFIITHLDRTQTAEAYCMVREIPLVHLLHNHSSLKGYGVKKADLIIYNTHHLREAVNWPAPSVVVHPPIWPDDYRVEPAGDCITLVNLQKAKGVGIFYGMAHMMPQQKFLGVTGAYGLQEIHDLPNVEILPQQADMRDVYKRTRVLLMPSTYESYGRCAIEAAVSGIPCMANNTPGLLEALGDAGTFPRAYDAVTWADAYSRMDWDEMSRRSRGRAAALDPIAELDVLEEALHAACHRAGADPQPPGDAA